MSSSNRRTSSPSPRPPASRSPVPTKKAPAASGSPRISRSFAATSGAKRPSSNVKAQRTPSPAQPAKGQPQRAEAKITATAAAEGSSPLSQSGSVPLVSGFGGASGGGHEKTSAAQRPRQPFHSHGLRGFSPIPSARQASAAAHDENGARANALDAEVAARRESEPHLRRSPHGGGLPLSPLPDPLQPSPSSSVTGRATPSRPRSASHRRTIPTVSAGSTLAAANPFAAQPTEVMVAIRVRPDTDALSQKSSGTGAANGLTTPRNHSRARRCLTVDADAKVLECVQGATSSHSSPAADSPLTNGPPTGSPAANNTVPVRFTFDTVYDEKTKQDTVFQDIGKKVVLNSVLEGFHGTVLCYGQSGSGKTHTMIGPDGGRISLKTQQRTKKGGRGEPESKTKKTKRSSRWEGGVPPPNGILQTCADENPVDEYEEAEEADLFSVDNTTTAATMNTCDGEDDDDDEAGLVSDRGDDDGDDDVDDFNRSCVQSPMTGASGPAKTLDTQSTAVRPHKYVFGEAVGLLPRTLRLLFDALEEKKRMVQESTRLPSLREQHSRDGEEDDRERHGDQGSDNDHDEDDAADGEDTPVQKKFSYQVTISALELYNEELRDLMPWPNPRTSTAPKGLKTSEAGSTPNRLTRTHTPTSTALTGGPAPSTAGGADMDRQATPTATPSSPSFLDATTRRATSMQRAGQASSRKLRIRDLGSKVENVSVFVEGLECHPVHSFSDAIKAVAAALKERRMGATRLNINSSRAHTLFFVKVRQTEEDCVPIFHATDGAGGLVMEEVLRREEKFSILTFVDLAGSERVSHTGAVGKRLEEAKNINLSLSLLGNVIRKLTEAASEGPSSPTHIPFRDSKLTRMLKDSFGGNCITYLLCNVSPDQRDVLETVSTLRFAKLAKAIKNKPVSNVTTKDLHGMQEALRLVRNENDCLRSENLSLREQLKNAHEYATWLEEQLAAVAERSTSRAESPAANSAMDLNVDDLFNADGSFNESKLKQRYCGVGVGDALGGTSSCNGEADGAASSPTTAAQLSRANLAEDCMTLARKLHEERNTAALARKETEMEQHKNAMLLDEIASRDARLQKLEDLLTSGHLVLPADEEGNGTTGKHKTVVVRIGPDGDVTVEECEPAAQDPAEEGGSTGVNKSGCAPRESSNRSLLSRRRLSAASAADGEEPQQHGRRPSVSERFSSFLSAYGFATRAANAADDALGEQPNSETGTSLDARAEDTTASDAPGSLSKRTGRENLLLSQDERYSSYDYMSRRSKLEQFMDSFRLAVAIVRSDDSDDADNVGAAAFLKDQEPPGVRAGTTQESRREQDRSVHAEGGDSARP